MEKFIYFIGFLALLFLTKKLKDKSVNKALIEVYRATREQNEEQFLIAMQQRGLKVFISTFTSQFLKLKFYVTCDNHEKVQEILKEIKMENIKVRDRLAVYQLMFSYSVERNDYKQIQHYYEKLKSLKEKDNPQLKNLYDEIEFIYSIFIKRDFSLIKELESRIAAAKDAAQLAVLYYYKARLHYAKGDINQCKKDLSLSKDVSKNEKWKVKIEDILNSGMSQFNKNGCI